MYAFKDIEEKVLEFWKDNQIFKKSLEKTKEGPRFVFFEGPPTANGLPGVHHVLPRAFKDIFCRYKTMQGFFVLRKAGWDTHGLPVEIEVEKQLGFTNKKEIEDYGIAKFNKKAKESVWKYKCEWEQMTERMGYWIDMDDPYITYENNYIESVWWIIKQIWDKGLLYKAHKVVPFCTRCGTSLSSHEVAQGYKIVTDKSVTIKFKIKKSNLKINERDLYILAWTTTPWTLPGNVALAVGKDINYVIVEMNNESYILAKDLAEKVLGTDFKVIKELKGKDLIGLEYEPLFDVPELKSSTSYKIYEADFVATTEGTGVVHTAVMYGEDDYNLGTKVGLPKVHTVDEQGKFKSNVGPELAGMYVKSKKVEDLIISKLETGNQILKTELYEHDYPFCWRCDTPLLYYAKDSWFIKMSAVNKEIMANNEKINWVPEHIRDGRFGQWLGEGKDWAFSRERYWGTPLPVWECGTCDNKEIIGSLKEIEEKGGVLPVDEEGKLDLHRPFIDLVKLKCPKCKSEMNKIPDLIDVWFDSGAMPYAQWHWPFENKDMIPPSLKLRRTSPEAPQFPADFIVEGIDQTRGWFYTLLAISTLLGKGPAYKNVIALSHILDEKGKKMSKSKGNVVSPFEVFEKYGADAPRWYFYTVNGPGDYKLFNTKDVQARIQGYLSTLQNCLNFYQLYNNSNLKKLVPSQSRDQISNLKLNLLDDWILSRLNNLIFEVTEKMDEYDVTTAGRAIEKFVTDDFSNWWLRRSRKRPEALPLLREIIIKVAKLTAPFTPFIAEHLYQELSKGQGLEPKARSESIHLEKWPEVNKKLIKPDLELEMSEVRDVITAGLAARKENQLKVRQPLRVVVVGRPKPFKPDLESLIRDELNVKNVEYSKSDSVSLDTEITPELRGEGYVRELMRQIQDMRKEAGYSPTEEVSCYWNSDDSDLSATINKWSEAIKKDVLLSDFLNQFDSDDKFDVKEEFEVVPNKKVWIGIRK